MSDSTSNVRLGMLVVISSGVLFSMTGSLIKLCGWNDPGGVLALRGFFAMLVISIAARTLVPQFRRSVVIAGALTFAQLAFYVWALQWTHAAIASLLAYTSLLWIPIISKLTRWEEPQPLDVLFSGLVLCAVTTFFADNLTTGNMVGNVLAMGCGLLWSVNLLYIRKEEKQYKETTGRALGADSTHIFVWCCMLGGAALSFLFYLAGHWSPPAEPTKLAWLILSGTQSTVAWLILMVGLPIIGAVRSNMLLSALDPTLAVVWGYLILDEVPGEWARIGGVSLVILLLLHGWLCVVEEPKLKE